MVDQKGYLKLIDFGFAKVLNKNKTFTLCGTPEYIAPEILNQSQHGYGKEADLWGFGVLLFEMMTGSTPFEDESP